MTLNNNFLNIFCGISLKKAVILLFLCNFTLIGASGPLCAQDQPVTSHKTDNNTVIKFYQKHISAIDGDRCPMYPHCSQYCAGAIEKHGFPMGWIMACDRLLRCGRDEVRLSPHVRVKGRELTFDPVSANDFWWFSPKPTGIDNSKPKTNLSSGCLPGLNPEQKE